MIIHTDVHTIIELNNQETSLLRDLLMQGKEEAEKLGREWERLRIDLLFTLPVEK